MKNILCGIFILTILNQTSCEYHSSLGDVEIAENKNDQDTSVAHAIGPNEKEPTGNEKIPGQYDDLDIDQVESEKSVIKPIDEIGNINTSGNRDSYSITGIHRSTPQDNLNTIKDNDGDELENDGNEIDNESEYDGDDGEMASDHDTEIDDDNIDDYTEENEFVNEKKPSDKTNAIMGYIRNNPGAVSLLIGSLIGTGVSIAGIPYLERTKPKCWISLKNNVLKLKRAVMGKPSAEESKADTPAPDSNKASAAESKTEKPAPDSNKASAAKTKTKKPAPDSKKPTDTTTSVSS